MIQRLFLSYNFRHQTFVGFVYQHLRTQPDLAVYFYTAHRNAGEWGEQVRAGLNDSNVFILFLGPVLGNVQLEEMHTARWSESFDQHRIWVQVASRADERAKGYCGNLDPIVLEQLGAERSFERLVNSEAPLVEITDLSETEQRAAAEQCAREIVRMLRMQWVTPLDIPQGYPFDYEKNIIDSFIDGGGRLPQDKLDIGCTANWPVVEKRSERDNSGEDNYWGNPVSPKILGDYRADEAAIVVDARALRLRGKVQSSWLVDDTFLTFPEAGPRASVCYPLKGRNALRIGILVSGGIAPGINAVIDGIVNRHVLYADPDRNRREPLYPLKILGFRDGLQGLLRIDREPAVVKSLPRGGEELADILSESTHRGGSVLRTSREEELLSAVGEKKVKEIVEKLTQPGAAKIDILYLIGGDGSMRAAHAIQTVARRKDADLTVVAIPKTMDNDILWVWQSFGFLSAVERAKEMIFQLHVEATSNPRLCVIQLFGSDSGFVASHAALASNVCDYVLIPEVGFRMETVIQCMTEKLKRRHDTGESPHGMIVMAETAVPRDYQDFYKREEIGLSDKEIAAVDTFVRQRGRVKGQTPDLLRTAALKIVAGSLQTEIRDMGAKNSYWKDFRVFTNEPRHLIRAIPPSTSDVIFGERLGALAVDAAMAGYSDCMVSQWLTEYVLVPLKLVVLGRKRLPPQGIFWRTVLASTGQPDEIVSAWPAED